MDAWRFPAPLLAAALLSASGTALAHDTWFQALPAAEHGEAALAVGTGNRFPLAETAVDVKHFRRSGCLAQDGAAHDLALLRMTDRATVLRHAPAGSAALACFVQLDPFEIELPPEKVAVYFKEIRPNATVLAAWADLKARGLPFRERYTKSARIELGATALPARTGTTMDVLRTAPAGAVTVRTETTFQVLRENRPLVDFPVELVNERSPVGLWFRTDVEGRIRTKLPLPGRWLLRGTDLRLAADDPTRWESQFITYAFDVGG